MNSGLVKRKRADWIAGGVFLVALIGALIFLFTTRLSSFPTTTTTTKSAVQTVQGAHGVSQRTDISETTTTNVIPPFWQSMAGSRTPIVLFCGVSLLIAFLLAAAVQRVLLGQYAFSIGPLTIPPDITGDEVKKEADKTLAVIPNSYNYFAAVREPEWATAIDPKLALVGCRDDIEREIRRIAGEHGIPWADTEAIGTLITSLSKRQIIEPGLAQGLRNLLDLGNRAYHGASVDESSIPVLRIKGRTIVGYLASL